ncbi:hypothetical protein CDL15_Pgr025181 [Punica granatum]|uniref:Subtilisin-like protease SBT5.3 n=1 Tax=Punica granatum TaxID=22663 RepID=A0A218W7Z2_PUNGR|nr:hypothetical protein CDL15_Pgr025181 [Punica granatum]
MMRSSALIALLFLSSFALASNAATSVTKVPHLNLSRTLFMHCQPRMAHVINRLDEAQTSVVHHYSKSFQGFSALLTPEQAEQLSGKGKVISIFESRMKQLHTTHSWEFLGVNSLQYEGRMPSGSMFDVIVGVIDSGLWPESRSYDDTGLGPVPERFRGECIPGENFTSAHCNRKIIGARYYYKGFEADEGPLESFNQTFFRSARDSGGHGSHTSSTIAGSVVDDVSLYGLGRGTARGGAPRARLAMYKVCWINLCSDADILAAMDDAISDGVDILSLSLSPTPPQPSYFHDTISIGVFHAFQKGILVSASAGNSFFPRTAINVAPWILTVAASTVDREFTTNIYLGNSKLVKGYSLNPFKMGTSYGLIAGNAAAALGIPSKNASTLDPILVKGKIVVCTLEELTDNREEKANTVKVAGGIGIVLVDPLAKDVGFQFAIPGSVITPLGAAELQAPGNGRQPAQPGFGQDCSNFCAPGAGSTPMDNTKKLIGKNPNGAETTPFDYGSGHVNPAAALDPGLIYDFDSADVINFLCSLGAGPLELKNLTGELLSCPKNLTPSYDLNYPSIGVGNMSGSLSVHRTVTYYGQGAAVYSSYAEYPAGVKLTVNPRQLRFSQAGEKLSYRIDFTPYQSSNGSFVFGSLTWSNGVHQVWSPIGLNVVSVSN